MSSRYTRALICAGSLALLVGTLGVPAVSAKPKPPSSGGGTPSSPPSAPAATNAFTNFAVSDVVGTSCPGGTTCTNIAAEPAIRADKNGTFYGTSENGIGGGTIAVRSTDGGHHYTALPSPDAISGLTENTGLAPSGGDTDVTVAPAKNAAGNYNVYAASLSLANIVVSTSTDQGTTWKMNPTAATIGGDDREWIAADGPSKVCISYHDLATSNIDVNCSADAGATFTQLGSAIDPAHAFLINNNEIGNLSIDPTTHVVYQVFSGIGSASEVVGGELGSNGAPAGTIGYHVVWVAVSTDGGKTFADHPVYNNPDTNVAYGHQFVNISLDKAGNAYAVYSDNHNLFYSYSTTHGLNWSAPVRVNKAPSATAIMPWSVAGDAGKLDVVWYGTSYYAANSAPDNYPATAAWNVYFAQNLSATTPGSTFTQTTASPVNHHGGVCESGAACTGNRDLFDDFGVAASPATGLASIIYSDDQFNPAAANSTACTSKATDTSSCNHTMIATQTAGRPIFTTR